MRGSYVTAAQVCVGCQKEDRGRALVIVSRTYSKEACVHSKERFTHSREPYTHSKEPYVHSKEPYIPLKESYIRSKEGACDRELCVYMTYSYMCDVPI